MATGSSRATAAVLLALALPFCFVSEASDSRLEYLLEKLETSPSFKVRVAAALALGKLEEPDAFGPMLKALMKEESEPVQLALLSAFAAQDYYEAIVAVTEACFVKYRLPGRTARECLEFLRDRATAFNASSWRYLLKKHGNGEGAARSAYILGATGDFKSLKLLARAVFKSRNQVRLQAIRALGMLGGKKAVAILKKARKRFRSTSTAKVLRAALALAAKGGFKPKKSSGMEYPAIITPKSYREALDRIRPIEPGTVAKKDRVPPLNEGLEQDTIQEDNVTDFVDWEEFQEILQERMQGLLQRCVKSVPRDVSVKGELKLSFHLSASGSPVSLELESESLGFEPLAHCLFQGTGSMKFDVRPAGVGRISYTFTVQTGKRVVDFSR